MHHSTSLSVGMIETSAESNVLLQRLILYIRQFLIGSHYAFRSCVLCYLYAILLA